MRWTWHVLIGRFERLDKLVLDLDKVQKLAQRRDTVFPEPIIRLPKRGFYLHEANDPPILAGRSSFNMFLPSLHYIELGENPVIQPTTLRKLFPIFYILYAIIFLSIVQPTADHSTLFLAASAIFYGLIFVPSLYPLRLFESWFIEQTFYTPR